VYVTVPVLARVCSCTFVPALARVCNCNSIPVLAGGCSYTSIHVLARMCDCTSALSANILMCSLSCTRILRLHCTWICIHLYMYLVYSDFQKVCILRYFFYERTWQMNWYLPSRVGELVDPARCCGNF
jgi:hypothetical protein